MRQDIPQSASTIAAAKTAQQAERVEVLLALGPGYLITDDGRIQKRTQDSK